jgi:hypothetical protein
MRRKDWLLAVSYWLLASELTPQPPSRKPILKVDSAIEGGVRRGRIGFEAWWLPKLKVDHLSREGKGEFVYRMKKEHKAEGGSGF